MFNRGKGKPAQPDTNPYGNGIDPASYVVTTDRYWLNPQLDAFADALERPGITPAEKVALTLRELAATRALPEWTMLVGDTAGSNLAEDSVDELRVLAQRSTGDAQSDADVLGLLTGVLVNAAWKVRGSGEVDTVEENAWPVFHSMLEEADEIGRRALDLVPGHVLAANCRLNSALGLGVPADEWWARFDEARAIDPLLYRAHMRMLQAVCQKWYGNHEVMFDFARSVARDAPVGSPLGAVLAMAHVEYWLKESEYGLGDDDRRLLQDAAERWVAGGEAALAHPCALQAHQVIAWILRDDLPRVNFHLSRTMGRISTFPWAYMRDGEGTYRDLMAKAGVRFPGM